MQDKKRKRSTLANITNNLDIPEPSCKKISRRWRELDDLAMKPKRKHIPQKGSSTVSNAKVVVTETNVNCCSSSEDSASEESSFEESFEYDTFIDPSNHSFNTLLTETNGELSLEDKYKKFNMNINYEEMSDHYDESEDDTIAADIEEEENIEQSHSFKASSSQKKKSLYKDEGDASYTCPYCDAHMWYNERIKKDNDLITSHAFSMCCLKGKVAFPYPKKPPPTLYRLFFKKHLQSSKKFYNNIRQYNNMFSFTSMGGKINHSINSRKGPYSFILSGLNYHCIGDLIPSEGKKPVYSQLYIHDTANEVMNRITAVSTHQSESALDKKIVAQIQTELHKVNLFAQQFQAAKDILAKPDTKKFKMVLLASRKSEDGAYDEPTASEVAALIVGDIDPTFGVRDIILQEKTGSIQRINELHPSYLPLQYPLLYPYGQDGYRDDMKHRCVGPGQKKTQKRISIREYLAYKLMHRPHIICPIIHSSRLLQQFIVDMYTMIESQRLLWIRTHQQELRVDLYQGLSDAVLNGETEASATGKRIVLPSSYTGSARYMMGNYQDAMAICRNIGYPDLFITFTCNPSWPEITRYCSSMNLEPSDCPHILSRIFYLKLRALMKVIRKGRLFGKIRAEIYTIEFQKRGLPHAHILLFLDEKNKPSTPDEIDAIISAEIPDKNEDPELFELVKKYMVHDPCIKKKKKAKCIQGDRCSKYFPKKFNSTTTIDEEGYPTYKRQQNGHSVIIKGAELDNQYVVPYNPTLLRMFHAHINVEKCNQSRAIKYLFKYISKGHDRVVVGLFEHQQNKDGLVVLDEIKQYLNCRYISSCEASWRAFGFPIHHRYPSVERLSFHLPNKQPIVYPSNKKVADVLKNPRVRESQFLAWMEINKSNDLAKTLTYSEFPKKFVYDKPKRIWRPRKKGSSVGRMSHISPSQGELYYLRLLLTQIRGPTSFQDIRTYNGVVYPTFKDTCSARGLLNDDREYISALEEASTWATGKTLRKLFLSMLLSNSLINPHLVWEKTSTLLSEDMLYIPKRNQCAAAINIPLADKEQAALQEINSMLQINGKSLNDYFPQSTIPQFVRLDMTNYLILQELSYDRAALARESAELIKSLNTEQSNAFTLILHAAETNNGGFFFIYGYGGTGKTYLWKALINTLRSKGKIVLPVASSGIAATLLPGGRTAHSRFAIPIDIAEHSVCSIWQNSPLADLIRQTSLIIWDEAPMIQRYCIEALNRTLQDIMHSHRIFGGKCVVMGGDFRQILPVIPKAPRSVIVDSSICSSFLWHYCTVFTLSENMRLQSANNVHSKEEIAQFSKWLLAIGDGNIGELKDDHYQIQIPPSLLIPPSDLSLDSIVDAIYHDMLLSLHDEQYFKDRAILAPTIEMVNRINTYMCNLLPGDEHEYLSSDSVCKTSQDSDTVNNLYTMEFLNTIDSSGLPPHRLLLKVGAPIMLIRNIDQLAGMCNGTRLKISKLGNTVIEASILSGSNQGDKVLIHRMDLNPSESRWPFKMQRRQFPITLSFAMTINKSQGQSLKNVGIYLQKPVFSHGQLYVALSRVNNMNGLKVLLPNSQQKNDNTTKNVVYKEIFQNL